MLSSVGKLTAAAIIIVAFVWLGPMCASLPAPGVLPMPIAALAPEPAVAASTAPAIAAAPVPAPVAPVVKPAARPGLTAAPYRMRKLPPIEGDKYIVSVLRANKADVPAVGVVMTLTTLVRGLVVERVESGPGQTLGAGTTSYFGLGVSTVVFDEVLDSSEAPGTELDWALAYRFQDDPATARRCFVLRTQPRRREPEGLTWTTLGQSTACEPKPKP